MDSTTMIAIVGAATGIYATVISTIQLFQSIRAKKSRLKVTLSWGGVKHKEGEENWHLYARATNIGEVPVKLMWAGIAFARHKRKSCLGADYIILDPKTYPVELDLKSIHIQSFKVEEIAELLKKQGYSNGHKIRAEFCDSLNKRYISRAQKINIDRFLTISDSDKSEAKIV
jgi:hypothetical protein